MTRQNYDAEFDSMRKRPLVFPHHTLRGGGLLPDMVGAHAAWYFRRCAMKNLKAIKEGAWYDGEVDHVKALANIAWSVARFYSLPDPSEFLKFMDVVKLEAMRDEAPWDDRLLSLKPEDYRGVMN